jgi:hypothetical protein
MDKRADLKEQYLRAAAREARAGNPVLATFWRNEAWMVEHPEGWLEYIRLEEAR